MQLAQTGAVKKREAPDVRDCVGYRDRLRVRALKSAALNSHDCRTAALRGNDNIFFPPAAARELGDAVPANFKLKAAVLHDRADVKLLLVSQRRTVNAVDALCHRRLKLSAFIKCNVSARYVLPYPILKLCAAFHKKRVLEAVSLERGIYPVAVAAEKHDDIEPKLREAFAELVVQPFGVPAELVDMPRHENAPAAVRHGHLRERSCRAENRLRLCVKAVDEHMISADVAVVLPHTRGAVASHELDAFFHRHPRKPTDGDGHRAIIGVILSEKREPCRKIPIGTGKIKLRSVMCAAHRFNIVVRRCVPCTYAQGLVSIFRRGEKLVVAVNNDRAAGRHMPLEAQLVVKDVLLRFVFIQM